jgi:hypothetical protein
MNPKQKQTLKENNMHYRKAHEEIDCLEDGLFFTLTGKNELCARILLFAMRVLTINSTNKKGD